MDGIFKASELEKGSEMHKIILLFQLTFFLPHH